MSVYFKLRNQNIHKHPTSISMKSVRISLILAIIALLAGSNSRGETVFVTQLNGDTCGALHILTVYQLGSDVIVTKHAERIRVFCLDVVTLLEATLEMDFPSIALREVSIFNNNAGLEESQVLYRNGVVENAYNPDWGDGWVDTLAAGYVNIKQYPWIYHPDLGWLKVTEGKMVKQKPHYGSSPKALSFYLYSADYGWLWTTEFTEKYYSFAAGEYKTVEEIIGG